MKEERARASASEGKQSKKLGTLQETLPASSLAGVILTFVFGHPFNFTNMDCWWSIVLKRPVNPNSPQHNYTVLHLNILLHFCLASILFNFL